MFTDTMTRWLEGITNAPYAWALRRLFEPLYDRNASQPIRTAGLVIKAGASPLAKIGASDFYALVNGTIVRIVANTDMPALVGTVVNATFNVFCFFVDQAGTVTVAMGTAGASYGAIKFPQFPTQKALVGFLIIRPTGTGNFVGGTTALDDATVAPNTAYISPTGGFDPAAIIG
jgi:hypothetical protein